jgi:hypothetical protein
MSTSKLHIRLAKDIEGTTLGADAGVVTNIYATGKDASAKGLRGITIPVAENEDIYRTVELEAGSYLIESVLPSGEIVNKEVLLEPGQDHRVSLHGEPSPHEWLSWQQYAGNVSRQKFAPPGKFRSIANAIRPVEDAFVKGLAEIGRGSFRERAFTGVDQWQTVDEMIGPGSEVRLEEMRQRTHAARDREPQADGLEWTSGPGHDDQTQVFHLTPDSGTRQGEIRDFLYWTANGAELIRLPNRWISIDDFNGKGIEVMTDLSQHGGKFRSSVMVLDPSFASILGYLTVGSLPHARLLINRARDMLYGKVNNPYAATVGAYLLLGADKPGTNDNWPRWIENLRNWFEWLPDGAVLFAWLKLHSGDSEAAIEELKQAFYRGIPLYSMGIKRLLEGLSLVSAEDNECREMERRVRRIAWRTNMDQYFTIVRLGRT